MISKSLTVLALIISLAACKKEDDSNSPSATLENGFYMEETLCDESQYINATYISGENFSQAYLPFYVFAAQKTIFYLLYRLLAYYFIYVNGWQWGYAHG